MGQISSNAPKRAMKSPLSTDELYSSSCRSTLSNTHYGKENIDLGQLKNANDEGIQEIRVDTATYTKIIPNKLIRLYSTKVSKKDNEKAL